MTVDEFKLELEKIVASLFSSGFGNYDPGIVGQMEKLSVCADGLGLKGGKRLLENLSGTMKDIKEGKSLAESGNLRLTALDFYVKQLPNEDNIEELLRYE